jgi:hypothetical protein
MLAIEDANAKVIALKDNGGRVTAAAQAEARKFLFASSGAWSRSRELVALAAGIDPQALTEKLRSRGGADACS